MWFPDDDLSFHCRAGMKLKQMERIGKMKNPFDFRPGGSSPPP